MKDIGISEFKAKFLALLEQVQKTKKSIRMTRFGKPVAEVAGNRVRRLDWLYERHNGGRVSPANDEADWDALRD